MESGDLPNETEQTETRRPSVNVGNPQSFTDSLNQTNDDTDGGQLDQIVTNSEGNENAQGYQQEAAPDRVEDDNFTGVENEIQKPDRNTQNDSLHYDEKENNRVFLSTVICSVVALLLILLIAGMCRIQIVYTWNNKRESTKTCVKAAKESERSATEGAGYSQQSEEAEKVQRTKTVAYFRRIHYSRMKTILLNLDNSKLPKELSLSMLTFIIKFGLWYRRSLYEKPITLTFNNSELCIDVPRKSVYRKEHLITFGEDFTIRQQKK